MEIGTRRDNSFIHSFRRLCHYSSIASLKPFLNRVRCSATSFSFQYPVFTLRSSCSCLCPYFRLPVTSTLPSNFPSTKCFSSPFPHNMSPIKLTFLLFTVCTIFLSSSTLCNTSSLFTRSVQLIFSVLSTAPHFKTFQVLLIYFLKCQRFSPIWSCAPM